MSTVNTPRCRLPFNPLLFPTSSLDVPPLPLSAATQLAGICLQEPSAIASSLSLLCRSSVPSIWGFVFYAIIVSNSWGCDYALLLILIYLVMRLKICQTTFPPPHLLLPLALPARPISPIPPLQPASCHTPPSSSPSPLSHALSYPYPSPPGCLLSSPHPIPSQTPPHPPFPHQQPPHYDSPLHLLLTNPIPSPTIPFSSRPHLTAKLLSFPPPSHRPPSPFLLLTATTTPTRDPCYVGSKQST